MNQLIPSPMQTALTTDEGLTIVVPAIIANAGERAGYHFLNFFISEIENPNTRDAYARRVWDFCTFMEQRGISDMRQVLPPHGAAYRSHLKKIGKSKPTIKQALAALRSLGDWLVVHHVLDINPFLSVRGPKLQVTKGKTPILSAEDVVRLFKSIPTDNLAGLRDRALIGLEFYTFARVSAGLSMKVDDYYPQGTSKMVRLQEKNGKINIIAVHHKLEGYLDEYIAAAGIADNKDGWLFRAANGNTKEKTLSDRPFQRREALRMIDRRRRQAGIETKICNHTGRATGITTFRREGGAREVAQKMAGHSDPRTTQLYDHSELEITREEVERVRY